MNKVEKISVIIITILLFILTANNNIKINKQKEINKKVINILERSTEIDKSNVDIDKSQNEINKSIVNALESLNQENEMISRMLINDIAEKTDKECLDDDDIWFLNNTPRITDDEMNAIFNMDLNNCNK